MRGQRLLFAGLLLCAGGLYVSWMLSLSYLLGLQLPCGGSDGCIQVALSPAARLFGLPVPVIGLVFYLALADLTLRSLWSAKRFRSLAVYRLAILGAAVSTGFTLYSVLVLQADCAWCIASNVIAGLLALVFAVDRKEEFAKPSRLTAGAVGLLSCVALAAMGVSAERLKASSQRFPWNPVALARLSPEELAPPDSFLMKAAPNRPVVVMFVDLACPACRGAFNSVVEAAHSGRASLAIRHMPEGLHPGALGLAVLCEEAAQQGKPLDFVRSVFRNLASSRPQGRTVLYALGLHESAPLREAARARVQRDLSLAARLGLSSTPSIFVVKAGATPEPAPPDRLAALLN